jgi:hypothetical protein
MTMIPAVTLTQLDGGLGIMSPTTGALPAVIGCSSSGTAATPGTYTRIDDLKTAFGAGPLVEAAAMLIEITGKPVVCCKAATVTDGAQADLVKTGVTGLCVVTLTAGVKPIDEYDVRILIVTGGTVGVSGITYRWSLDGGRTYSPETALGTATKLAITDGTIDTGVSFDLTSATLVAGDYWTCRTTPPTHDATTLLAATTALKNSSLEWDFCLLADPGTATNVAALDTWMTSLFNAGKDKAFLAGFRRPSTVETEATYLTAWGSAFGSVATTYGAVGYGYAKTRSSISGRIYKRSPAWSAAVRACQLYLGQDMAEVALGPLSGVTLGDSNGNPDDHDEYINPGGDAARGLTLRTIPGYAGAYICNPRMLHPTGSDFQYWQFRAVMNTACAITRQTLNGRLSKAIRLNAAGTILESEARDIEALVNAKLRAALTSIPSCSSVTFVLKRDDVVLSTQTLTGDVRIVPLAYPKQINVTLAFNNPALRAA